MATGGAEIVGYSLAKVGTLTLEKTTDKEPTYISIVVCQDKIVVLDFNTCNVRIHRLHDGKVLASSDRRESDPRDMCLMDDMTICVLHGDGMITIISTDYTDMSRDIKTIRTLRVNGLLDEYHGVVRLKNSLVVSGVRQDTMYWCFMSLDDGYVETIHQICKGYVWSRVTTKDNMMYIACDAGDKSPDNNGVYGFDILNPSQSKYTYKHQHLQNPTSIVINEDGNIFVCNNGLDNSCIHQLTASCQLVAIFTQRIPSDIYATFWDNGCLYTTRWRSSDITVFQPGYQGSHKASKALLSDERKHPVIEKTAIKIGQRDPIQRSVEENLNQARIQMSTEDQDLFLKVQQEMGTTLFFSKGPQTLIDDKDSLKTEKFLQDNRPDMMEKWHEFQKQGKLTPELIGVIYAKERNPELLDKKDDILGHMQQLNIIVNARSFDENGVKEEDFFLTPCVLHQESPTEVISHNKDPNIVSTSVLCFVLTENVMQRRIFNELLAACVRRWPVAKKVETSEILFFCNCAVYNLDLFHRLILHYRNRVVFARIIRMVSDEAKTPDAKLWTRVRKFITIHLRSITSRLDPNLEYEMCVQSPESQDVTEDSMFHFSPPFQMWFLDEVFSARGNKTMSAYDTAVHMEHDPDSPITREHINHARLNVALVTVCGKAMREVLLTYFDRQQYTDIYQAILAQRAKLIPARGKQLLNQHQIQLVFPDPTAQTTGTVDQFDLSLLYTLIRNVSTVPQPTTLWGNDPLDTPRDSSLGASVERIRSYRNLISGHSPDAKMEQQEFEEYWKKFDAVLRDIENALGKHVYCSVLTKHRSQVISVFEA